MKVGDSIQDYFLGIWIHFLVWYYDNKKKLICFYEDCEFLLFILTICSIVRPGIEHFITFHCTL